MIKTRIRIFAAGSAFLVLLSGAPASAQRLPPGSFPIPNGQYCPAGYVMTRLPISGVPGGAQTFCVPSGRR